MKKLSLALCMVIMGNTPLLKCSVINKEFDAYIRQAISDAGIAGMGIAIVSGDSIVFNKGYGHADIKNSRPFTPHTVMNIASISKTFIGVAIMQAVEDNLIDLDDDVNKILPFQVVNPNLPESIITLRHLMRHMSGIRDEKTTYFNSYHYGVSVKAA